MTMFLFLTSLFAFYLFLALFTSIALDLIGPIFEEYFNDDYVIYTSTYIFESSEFSDSDVDYSNNVLSSTNEIFIGKWLNNLLFQFELDRIYSCLHPSHRLVFLIMSAPCSIFNQFIYYKERSIQCLLCGKFDHKYCIRSENLGVFSVNGLSSTFLYGCKACKVSYGLTITSTRV